MRVGETSAINFTWSEVSRWLSIRWRNCIKAAAIVIVG